MKKYLSPQEAAEELEISLAELQQYIIRGELTLYATGYANTELWPLFRYTAVQFFASPDSFLSTVCSLWEVESCPDDCEHLRDTKGNSSDFCGPYVQEWPLVRHLKLDQLIIKRKELRTLLLKDKTTAEQKKIWETDKLKEAKNYVKNCREDSVPDYEIAWNLTKRHGLENTQAHDLIFPSRKESTQHRSKQRQISRLKEKYKQGLTN